MTLNAYKAETLELCARKGWNSNDIYLVWLLFMEEIGELASAIRHYKKRYQKQNIRKGNGIDVVMELGDVFNYLFQIAGMLGVDLDDMWVKQIQKANNKTYNKISVRNKQ